MCDLQLGCSGWWTAEHHQSQEACQQPNSPAGPIPPARTETHKHTFVTLCYLASRQNRCLTCRSSFSMADITIRPLHTMGAASSTRKPIDMLTTRRAHSRAQQKTLKSAEVVQCDGSPRDAIVGEWDHQIVCRERIITRKFQFTLDSLLLLTSCTTS